MLELEQIWKLQCSNCSKNLPFVSMDSQKEGDPWEMSPDCERGDSSLGVLRVCFKTGISAGHGRHPWWWKDYANTPNQGGMKT